MAKIHKNKSRKKKGGAATEMPLSYYNPGASEPSANAGRDLLKAIQPIGIRPKIGGKHTRKQHKIRGGFVPSIMDNFVMAASKYIVPIALFAGYKLMTKKGKKSKKDLKQTRRRK
jgi:hypothetical protein